MGWERSWGLELEGNRFDQANGLSGGRRGWGGGEDGGEGFKKLSSKNLLKMKILRTNNFAVKFQK